MIKIDMDNGKRYFFFKNDYSDYEVGDKFLIVYNGKQWIGCFMLSHLVGFFVEKEQKNDTFS